jgi:hypothetical protein
MRPNKLEDGISAQFVSRLKCARTFGSPTPRKKKAVCVTDDQLIMSIYNPQPIKLLILFSVTKFFVFEVLF